MAPPRRTLPCYLITSGGKIVLWIGNLWSRLRTVSAEAAAMAMRKASKSEVDYSRGHALIAARRSTTTKPIAGISFAIVAREQSRPMREGRWPDQ
jgi:hypothetical protein